MWEPPLLVLVVTLEAALGELARERLDLVGRAGRRGLDELLRPDLGFGHEAVEVGGVPLALLRVGPPDLVPDLHVYARALDHLLEVDLLALGPLLERALEVDVLDLLHALLEADLGGDDGGGIRRLRVGGLRIGRLDLIGRRSWRRR